MFLTIFQGSMEFIRKGAEGISSITVQFGATGADFQWLAPDSPGFPGVRPSGGMRPAIYPKWVMNFKPYRRTVIAG